MPSIVPLVLTTGAAVCALRERNRRLDEEEEEKEQQPRRRAPTSRDTEGRSQDGGEAAEHAEQHDARRASSRRRTSVASSAPSSSAPQRRRPSTQGRPSVDRRKSSADSSKMDKQRSARAAHPEFASSSSSSDSDEEETGALQARRSSRGGEPGSSTRPSQQDVSKDKARSRRGEGDAMPARTLSDSPVGYGSDVDPLEKPIGQAAITQTRPQQPQLASQRNALAASPAMGDDSTPAGRPSAQHSSHHWQRFYNLLHPNFLHPHQDPHGPQSANTDNRTFPRTATVTTSEGASPAARRDHAGRGAATVSNSAGSQPAVSFRHEVSVGGRLLHPQVPSILRSRPNPSSSQPDSTLPTPQTPTSGASFSRPGGLAIRRTLTSESEMSTWSDNDADTLTLGRRSSRSRSEYSAEDEDEVADRVLGRTRKEKAALRTGRGRGRGQTDGKARRPSRAMSTLALAGNSLPLRGWARRKQLREQNENDDEEGGDTEQPDSAMDRDTEAQDASQAGRDDDAQADDDDGESDDEDNKVQQYRKTPIVSGIMAPFSIMLEVPGFTSSWYLSTGRETGSVVYAKNPVILDVGLAFSMAFAVMANLFIILRFLEVLRPRKSTLVAIVLLTLHDSINISALAVFGKIHAVNDGFTYSEGYWMTMGSTLASIIVNFTLIADYVNTKEFKNAGSGLSRKQRELVIMTMLVLFYLSIGALIYSFLLGQNFESSLYFIICTLFTIGFGDITPKTTAARIVLFIYAPIGIVLVALLIATTRETILEQFEQSYKKRREAVKTRYLERQEAKKVNRQLRRAVRLRQVTMGRGGARQWLAENSQLLSHVDIALPVLPTGLEGSQIQSAKEQARADGPIGKMLDITRAFFETGFSRGYKMDASRSKAKPADPEAQDETRDGSPERKNVGGGGPKKGLASGLALSAGTLVAPVRAGTAFLSPRDTAWSEKTGGESSNSAGSQTEKTKDSPETPVAELADAQQVETGQAEGEDNADGDEENQDEMELMEASLRKHREEMEQHWEKFKHEVAQQERNEFVAKMVVSGTLFLVFWLLGAGIFVATEGWNFFEGLYFGFVFFSTIGYGDFSPTTPSGRAFFIVWALFGVGILTVIFSVLGDAWGTIYKSTLTKTTRKNRWKSRLRKKRKRGAKREGVSTTDRTNDEADNDAPNADGGPDSSRAEGGSRVPSGVASMAPSEAGDDVDDDVEDEGPDSSRRPRMRRSGTLSSMQGDADGNPTTTPTTPQRKKMTVPAEQLPLHLARAAMHLHSEASHLLESQRHVLMDAVSAAPSLHRRLRKLLRTVAAGGKLPRGAMTGLDHGGVDGDDGGAASAAADDLAGLDDEEVHRRELERLEAAAVSALEGQGDSVGVAAVRQLFALVHYDAHLSTLIESSHALRDTLIGQERELGELRARVVELETRVVDEGLEDDDGEEAGKKEATGSTA